MTDKPIVNGEDIPVDQLRPLRERNINLETHKGYQKILSSIPVIGLIEPLCVYKEEGGYVILDGYLRHQAFLELGIPVVPCIVYANKEAYTFNRMVNRLSAYQEMRMLRKSLETLDEPTIATVFGMRSIRHRLAPNLVQQLHPKVAEAFEGEVLGKTAAGEMACVVPDRQVEMLKEMKRTGDYGPAFIRALILKTPPEQRNPNRNPRKSWSQEATKKRDMVARLEEASRQHDFYTNLYRQYSTDLMKMSLYVRRLITHPSLQPYLEQKHVDTLASLREVVLEAEAAPAEAT